MRSKRADFVEGVEESFFYGFLLLIHTCTNCFSSSRVLTTKYTIIDSILFHYGELHVSRLIYKYDAVIYTKPATTVVRTLHGS